MTEKKESFREAVLRLEFEYRIFVSFGIVIAVALLSLNTFDYLPSPFEALSSFLGIGRDWAQSAAYLIAAVFMVAASALRIWAGSTLSSHRMMAFQVQTDSLLTDPPYTLCRNPIYLADFTAFCGFAVVMPSIAVSLPFFLLLHYRRLIAYEQTELRGEYRLQFSTYEKFTPPFFPTLRSICRTILISRSVTFSKDGVRHNALYLLFVPGFIVASFTHNFFLALAIGLPAVFDWAIIHTIVGTADRKEAANAEE